MCWRDEFNHRPSTISIFLERRARERRDFIAEKEIEIERRYRAELKQFYSRLSDEQLEQIKKRNDKVVRDYDLRYLVASDILTDREKSREPLF
jgi:hypothetical protein